MTTKKNKSIQVHFDYDKFSDIPILHKHDYNKILGNTQKFEFEGKQYSIGIGIVVNNKGIGEILEISIGQL